MIKKVIIGLVAVVIVAGGVVAVLIATHHKDEKKDKTSKKVKTEITSEEKEEEITETGEGKIAESASGNATENPDSSENVDASEASDKPTVKTGYPKAGQANASGTIFLSFDGKSTEEVIENIVSISQTTKDATLENFPERCVVYPTDWMYDEDGFDWVFYFWDEDTLDLPEGICQMDIHIVRNEDGTLNQGSRAGIIIVTKDRDRWEELYTTCCEALMRMLGRDSLMTSGSGDYESSLYMTYFVSKKIEGDGTFKLHVEIPLRDPAEQESET